LRYRKLNIPTDSLSYVKEKPSMLIELEEDRDYQNLKIFIFGAYEKYSQKPYIDKKR
jgi:hypothetical protein